MFQRMGIPVYDSDASVHDVLAKGGAAVGPIERAFPGVVVGGAVDRDALGKRVFGDDAALNSLESIVHPLVRQAQDRFLQRCARRHVRLVVLDVPLLFEVNLDIRCDVTMVVSAPAFIQSARVMARCGMTREKFEGIMNRQIPDVIKRRRANFVVPSSLGRAETLRHLARIARLMKEASPNRWPPDAYADRTTRRRSTYARAHPRYRNYRA